MSEARKRKEQVPAEKGQPSKWRYCPACRSWGWLVRPTVVRLDSGALHKWWWCPQDDADYRARKERTFAIEARAAQTRIETDWSDHADVT